MFREIFALMKYADVSLPFRCFKLNDYETVRSPMRYLFYIDKHMPTLR